MEFSGEDFVPNGIKDLGGFSTKPTKSKGGRPTIGDNSLLGSRTRWLSFFEECWPDIGWPLLQIRKRRTSTIGDVQKIFEICALIKGRQRYNSAEVLLGGLSATSVSVQELIRQRSKSSELRFALQDMERELPELERLLREAVNALTLSTGEDRATFAAEVRRRAQLVWNNKQIEVPLKRRDCDEREAQVRTGERYIYCSELLDFLRSGRRAVTPIRLANAVAGLPDMRWRQSDARCSKMSQGQHYPHHPYAVFLTVERLCKRMSGPRGQSRVDSFRVELANLPQRDNRDFLCKQWRDFRLAIEEVYSTKNETGFIPYALTSAFLKNVARPKTSVENVLDAQEKLTPTKNTQNTDRKSVK